MTPTISVIIPVYNTEAYLKECLDSILGQTLRKLEVICVDDCSTDSSPDILADYAHKDDRVRVFRQPENMKPGAARNRGLEKARGRYVYFMDSDDLLFSPTTLEEITKTADTYDLDLLLFSSTAFVDGVFSDELRPTVERLRSGHSVPETLCGRVSPGPDFLAEILDEKCYSPCIWLRLYKTEMLREANINFLPNNIHEDTLFTPLTHFFSKRSMAVQTTCLNRRIRPGSIMTESAFGITKFRDTYQIFLEWASKPLPDFLSENGRGTWMKISSRLLGHACKSFSQLENPATKLEIILGRETDTEQYRYIACLMQSDEKQSKIDSLTQKRDRLLVERDKILEKKREAEKEVKLLKRKLEKMRNTRDSRPNSIRGAIAFIFRRLAARCGAFLRRGRNRT